MANNLGSTAKDINLDKMCKIDLYKKSQSLNVKAFFKKSYV